jgi:hypothetical protein
VTRHAEAVAYRRDAGAEERERARAVARIRDLEERWTPTFWSEIAAPRGVLGPRPDAEWTMLDLSLRVAALEALESDWAAIERDWTKLAPIARDSRSIDLETVREHAPRTRSSLAPVDIGPVAVRFRVEVVGTEEEQWAWIAAEIAAREIDEDLDIDVRFDVARTLMHMVASVPRGVGRLRVRPQTTWHDLGHLLAPDIELGDPGFDGAFKIDGDEHAARAILSPDTRRSLALLAERGAVELAVEAGVATLGPIAVRSAHADRAIAAAVQVMIAAQDAPVRPLRARAQT